MITVPEVVGEVIKKTPYLEEGIARGLINLSALAREILPEVCQKLMKEVQEGAIVMALKRLAPELTVKNEQLNILMKEIEDITVKSNLVEFTFLNSPTLLENYKKLLNKIKKPEDYFITLSHGIYESTFIANASLESIIDNICVEEAIILKHKNLSSISIKLPSNNIETPGYYYTIFKTLAWNGINLIEAISTSNEITIVFRDEDIDKAFSVLKKLTD